MSFFFLHNPSLRASYDILKLATNMIKGKDDEHGDLFELER
jgi:hypothetical protein